MKDKMVSRLAGLGCLALILLFAFLIFNYEEEKEFILIGFILGFIAGILWICIVLFDPQSRWYVRKTEGLLE